LSLFILKDNLDTLGAGRKPRPSIVEDFFPVRSQKFLNPPPGVSTEAIEAGLDARKACIEERSVVGNYVSTAEVRLTTQTVPDRRPNATVGGGFRPWEGGSV
jgi:hypothetical protein